MKDAWVLRLREESKEEDMTGDYYFAAEESEELDWLTQDLSKALIIPNKESYIENLKIHEQLIYERYGEDAICNFGYTNIMKHFEFVEVEFETV
ncbi:hypothetical protein J1P26_22720 [Neobacillus sp. MM2021_6]|uniref:hypothetical protein n=1 Tax=Bacillaceae TaxID=186817 RepID=UPI00140DB8FC|nr:MULTISPECIES: hypothetical protein [Bacillaceae]MBO0962512.1 hypothetical protein [Neobacillus sp. MM2021_6]NHC21011.1 hypothetical protein [Bacillus sp. MM2020_4]